MTNELARMLSKRTQVVWASFFVVISSMLVLLQIGGGDFHGGVILTTLSSMNERPEEDPVFQSNVPVDHARWSSIVIHHLGQPAGTVDSIHRDHVESGLDGLGFHFVIGNGNGLGDGVLHTSYRWLDQLPAARPVWIEEERWNDGIITICIVGNGNRRPFTERQLLHLSRLVQRLQLELRVPASEVWLASELGNSSENATSPGEFFAEANFRSQLLDIPRNY
ncbi:N-acetylmuramoyl-L-alanine amidase [PVC group bacterium]|nr:N-acetylmuramoyl-L-alanine amidase [PVC group bacterium]